MTNPKPPTVRSVAALLKRSHREQATGHTAGFHVSNYRGDVLVNHWPESVLPGNLVDVAAEKAREREMLRVYAGDLTAAGWRVRIDADDYLIVTDRTLQSDVADTLAAARHKSNDSGRGRGFTVSRGDADGEVIVRVGPDRFGSQRGRDEESRLLDAYAGTLESAGYQIARGGDWLVVSRKEGE